ncbi:MAG: hypothetical protein K1X67_20955 [Fimbriimonadaceae bacterium]|nr:hypothetical protein [Fimbriimonadaceae bacterium]
MDRIPWLPLVVAIGTAVAVGALLSWLFVWFVLPEREVSRELKAYLGNDPQPVGGFDCLVDALTVADRVARGPNPNIMSHLAPQLRAGDLLAAAHPGRRAHGQTVSMGTEQALDYLLGFDRGTEVGLRIEQVTRGVVVTGRQCTIPRYGSILMLGRYTLVYGICIAIVVAGIPKLIPAVPPDMDRRLDQQEQKVKEIHEQAKGNDQWRRLAAKATNEIAPNDTQNGIPQKPEVKQEAIDGIEVPLAEPERFDNRYDWIPSGVAEGEKKAIIAVQQKHDADPLVRQAQEKANELKQQPSPARIERNLREAEGLTEQAKRELERAQEEYQKAANKRAEAENSRFQAKEARSRVDGLKKVADGLAEAERGVTKLADQKPDIAKEGRQEVLEAVKQVSNAKLEQEAAVGEAVRQLEELAKSDSLTPDQQAAARKAAEQAKAALDQIQKTGIVSPEIRKAIEEAAKQLRDLAPSDPKAVDAAAAALAAPAVLQQIATSASDLQKAEEAAKNPGATPPSAAGDLAGKKDDAQQKLDEAKQDEGKKDDEANKADDEANKHEEEGKKAEINAEKLLLAAAILLSPIPDPIKILAVVKLLFSGLSPGSGGGKGGTKGKGEGNKGDKKGSPNGQPGGKDNGEPGKAGDKPGTGKNNGGKKPADKPGTPGNSQNPKTGTPGTQTGTPGKSPGTKPGGKTTGNDKTTGTPGQTTPAGSTTGGQPGRGLPLKHLGQGSGDLRLVETQGRFFELRAGTLGNAGEERVIASFPAADSPPIPLVVGENGGVLYADKTGKLLIAKSDGPPMPTKVTAGDLGIDPSADILSPYHKALAALVASHPNAVLVFQEKVDRKQGDVFFSPDGKSAGLLLWLTETEENPIIRQRRLFGLLATELAEGEKGKPETDVVVALREIISRTPKLPIDSPELAKRIPLFDRVEPKLLRVLLSAPSGNGVDARIEIERLTADGTKILIGQMTERSFAALLKGDSLRSDAAAYLSGQTTSRTPLVVPGKGTRLLAIRLENDTVASVVLEEDSDPAMLIWVKAGEKQGDKTYRAPASAFEEAYRSLQNPDPKRDSDPKKYSPPPLVDSKTYQRLDLFDRWVGHEVEVLRKRFSRQDDYDLFPDPSLLFGEAVRVGAKK